MFRPTHKAIELTPQDASSHYNLAATYFNKRNFTLAEEYCKKAKDLGYSVPKSFFAKLAEAQKLGHFFELK